MAFLVGLAMLLAGCGHGDRLPTYEVTGQVTYTDGVPVNGGTILFESIEHAKAARGLINSKGEFRLGTYEQDDGAVEGKHLVAIIPGVPEGFDPDSGKVPRTVDMKYSHMDTSGLEFEVAAEGKNYFEVSLQRAR